MISPTRFVSARLSLPLLALFVLPALQAGPWESLFNGKDLAGWRVLNGTAPYTVEGEAIVGATVAGSPNSFLATDRSFGDFILELEIKQEGGPSNSGVQFRGLSNPGYMNSRVHGYQFEIDPGARAWSGGIYDEARRGWLYPVSLNPTARTAYRYGEWNRLRIEAIGDSLRTWINDQPVSHVIDAATREGFIALQIHSISDASAAGRRVLFRNLRIQTTDLTPAPTAPIFVRTMINNHVSPAEHAAGWRLLWDGVTLSGWQRSGATAATPKWQITEGEWVASAGGEIVRTDAAFEAFELQFEFNVPAGGKGRVNYLTGEPSAKTGTTGDAANRFSYALADDAVQGTNTPQSLGSLSGFVTRAKMPNGAAIVPKAGAWQHGRIIAHADGRVEHWLNGIQVVTYDRRDPTFAGVGAAKRGHIELQSEQGDLRFRSLKIRELR